VHEQRLGIQASVSTGGSFEPSRGFGYREIEEAIADVGSGKFGPIPE